MYPTDRVADGAGYDAVCSGVGCRVLLEELVEAAVAAFGTSVAVAPHDCKQRE